MVVVYCDLVPVHIKDQENAVKSLNQICLLYNKRVPESMAFI